MLTAAGQTPATSADIDFAYPKGGFRSEAAILKLAGKLERLMVGAYLGAAENMETPDLRLPIGQIAANEAQHAGALAALQGRSVIGKAFAPALSNRRECRTPWTSTRASGAEAGIHRQRSGGCARDQRRHAATLGSRGPDQGHA